LGRGSEDKKGAGGEVGVGHAVEVHTSCVTPLRKMTTKGKRWAFGWSLAGSRNDQIFKVGFGKIFKTGMKTSSKY
jgi:hypothetical protein